MVLQPGAAPTIDLAPLRAEARALLQPPPPVATGAESALRQAYRLIGDPLLRLQQQATTGGLTRQHLATFEGVDQQAALLYYLRHLAALFVTTPADSRDLRDAKHDFSFGMDILVGVQGAEAMALLYDDAMAQAEGEHGPRWTQVALRCLLALTRMPEAVPQALAFLRDHGNARRQVEGLMSAPDAHIAAAIRTLGELYVQARHTGTLDTLPALASALTTRYRQYDPHLLPPEAAEVPLLLGAEVRVRRALAVRLPEALLPWLAEGSSGSAALVFALTRAAFPPLEYADVLGRAAEDAATPLPRRIAAVLELAQLNHATQLSGGDATLNALLTRIALQEDEAHIPVASEAMRALGTVEAINEILDVMEQSLQTAVGEAGILAAREIRRLPRADSVVRARPALRPAYDEAKAYLLQLQGWMEAAWSAQSDELMQLYLDRLREAHATPELQQLCQKNTRISEFAKQTLSALLLSGKG